MNVRKLIIFSLMILMILTIVPSIISAEPSQKVQDGSLDLSEQPLDQLGPVKLSGEWKFYWNQLVEPRTETNESASRMVEVPNTWGNYADLGGQLSKEGYATYHMTIHLNQQDVGKILAFYLPSIASSYDLWVNEDLITSNGKVGKSIDTSVPGDNPKMITVKAEDTQLELFFQVANFHQRKAGLWESIQFGTSEQITQHRDRKIIFEAFVIGCIFIIGFYHLVMFFLRPKSLSLLYLAIACFSIVLRTMLLSEKLILFVIPNLDWEFAVKLEYISALTALIFFALFMKTTLFIQQGNRMIQWINSIIVLYMIFILLVPARIFTNTYVIFQLLIVGTFILIIVFTIIGMIRKSSGAMLTFFALIILFTAALNDLFYFNNQISTNELVSFGFLMFLFFQAVHLARGFTSTFDKNEKLSKELRALTSSLEEKVKKRTTELRHANQNLKKLEEARSRLFASVSHELNTPLTFIQGYVKAMLDGVIGKDDTTNLRAIHNDTKIMARLIEDLQELSKLESGQITFQLKNVDIVQVITEICAEQRAILFKSGFTFHLNNDIVDEKPICFIDPVRIKQVMHNLLVNARKFTKEGGQIVVTLEKSSNDHCVKVSVEDNGKGISRKNLPYIFERFRKEDGRVEKGAGLGLAIVKEIIEHHQGTVGATSQKEKGSTFYFTLPLYK